MRNLMLRHISPAARRLARQARWLARPGLVTRPAARVLWHDDRGVVGVLVAALLGTGVLLGMGALVIDLGQVYQNRAELQNGADASALAVASNCALGGTGACVLSSVLPLVTHYADANASGLTGHQAGIELVCGSMSLGLCPASAGGLTDCPAAPPTGINYVDVHTVTLTGGGSSVLPPFFGRMLGDENYSGSSVKACAQAEWGGPASATATAFTISACSWYSYTGDGLLFASPPPYPPNLAPAALSDHVLVLRGSRGSRASGCPPFEPYGQDAAGTFGWTSDQGSCSGFIDGSYRGTTGTATSDCQTALQEAQENRTVVYVPVYSSVTASGAGISYNPLGFAAFVVTGYRLSSTVAASDWLSPANNCTGGRVCINGYFTRGLIPSTGALGGNDLGASIVKLTG
jgi:hypothetical protein